MGADDTLNAPAGIEDLLAHYRRIVEATQEGIWTIDGRARTTFVNHRMAAMLGYAPEEMRGRSLLDFMDDEWRATAQTLIARRNDGIAEEHEFKFVRKDGSCLWTSVFATPIRGADGSYGGALAMVRDVGTRREVEERFRGLFENAPHVLWEEDLSDVQREVAELRRAGVTDFGAHLRQHPEVVSAWLKKIKVLDVNQAAVRLYESGDKASLLAGLGRILTAESFVVLREELAALAEGQTVFESEAVNQTFTGRKNYVLLKAMIAPGSEATWSRVYVSIVDITARKRLEEQLRESQKMEAIGRLAGGVAHDFNNLLTVIRGNAGIMQMAEATDAIRAEALAEIERAAERGAALTRQLLTFSRRQVLQLRCLDLNDVVSGLARMLERVLGEDVRIEQRLHAVPLLVRADAAMLDQVLMNLAVNARDAMPEGGRLVIETAPGALSQQDRLRFPEARPGSYACVRVTDTGCGIAPAAMEHVFEPFFTTKEQGKGTGLGLATVLGIVEQHGGVVRVASEPGRGAAFSILLPVTEREDDRAPARETAAPPRGGTESILLVEDETPVRTLTQRLLESRGYKVQSAATGAEAWDIWRASPDAFALVLTDVVMPGGLSGRDLAQRMRAARADVKIVLMSGYPGDVAGQGLPFKEGFAFLQKPFGATGLLACLRARLDGIYLPAPG
jgi:PAS domain S-box-containing protein